MRTKIIEATDSHGLYLKAAVTAFEDADWNRISMVQMQEHQRPRSLLTQEGWTPRHFIVQDLSPPGPGGIFCMGGIAEVDIRSAPTVF